MTDTATINERIASAAANLNKLGIQASTKLDGTTAPALYLNGCARPFISYDADLGHWSDDLTPETAVERITEFCEARSRILDEFRTRGATLVRTFPPRYGDIVTARFPVHIALYRAGRAYFVVNSDLTWSPDWRDACVRKPLTVLDGYISRRNSDPTPNKWFDVATYMDLFKASNRLDQAIDIIRRDSKLAAPDNPAVERLIRLYKLRTAIVMLEREATDTAMKALAEGASKTQIAEAFGMVDNGQGAHAPMLTSDIENAVEASA